MTEFNKSRWAQTEFSQEYRDNADEYIVERERLIAILKSFYKRFVSIKAKHKILDLGSGDGIITHELLKLDNSIDATLVDGSGDMLQKARERLKEYKNIHTLKAAFQEILGQKIELKYFDFIVSSLAIHHLTLPEKIAFFKTIFAHLNTDSYFVNIDVIRGSTETLERWYLSLWEEWIEERKDILRINGYYHDDIAQRYKKNTDNKPDTLDQQLEILRTAGFSDVDCYYKYGIFVIFGGRKQ